MIREIGEGTEMARLEGEKIDESAQKERELGDSRRRKEKL